jgi:selenocysteine lyase/cysteine desulfurase
MTDQRQRLQRRRIHGCLAAGISAGSIALIGDPEKDAALCQDLRKEGIEIALRAGNLRFSPHLYNTATDIERALGALERSRATMAA